MALNTGVIIMICSEIFYQSTGIKEPCVCQYYATVRCDLHMLYTGDPLLSPPVLSLLLKAAWYVTK